MTALPITLPFTVRDMPTIPEALQIAVQQHQKGRLREAEQIYRQILQLQPNHADARHLLGLIAHQMGKHEQAIDLIQQAIALNSREAVFHNNLGEALRSLQRLPEAKSAYQRAMEMKPGFVSAMVNYANLLKNEGEVSAAIELYQQALQFNPQYANAYYNLGIALQDQQRWEEALAAYERTLALEPKNAECHYQMSCVYHAQGRLNDSAAAAQRAITLKPKYFEAHKNLGISYQDQGQYAYAIASYSHALELQPSDEVVLNNLGVALNKVGKSEQAIAMFQRALQIKPTYLHAMRNLANSYNVLGKLEDAVAMYEQVLAIQPRIPSVVDALVYVSQQLCRWNHLPELTAQIIEMVDDPPADLISTSHVTPFSYLVLHDGTSAQQQWRAAHQFVTKKVRWITSADPLWNRTPRQHPSDKLRLGYLSADFHSHATACLIAELFEQHDRNRFTLYGYSFGPQDSSPSRQRMVQGFDHFVDIKDASYLDSARRIASDEIDILIDLKGYTHDGRVEILAYRPAPIQVNFLGYPGTMGADFIDYILVDDYIVPPEQQPYFSEKLVHLPGCYQVNDSLRAISPQTPTRAECGLPETGFVFCCFNNNYKITPAIFDVWMELLREIPQSVLWLYSGNAFAPDNLRREAQQRGIAPERLVFSARAPLPEHLARHRLADLFLDTFPVNAHTTASDALWGGCPLLTLSGDTFISRVAGSLLQTLSLPELITTSLAEYKSKALQLARQPELLVELRSRLAANRLTSTLFNAQHFARKMEAAFTKMWSLHCAGEAPQSFRVTETMLQP
jgi:protein O-GlcNAc transferase